MPTIYKVSQLPTGNIPNDVVYYNPITREILTSVGGQPRKFQSIVLPKYVDSISIKGYFPLFVSEVLAKSRSPSGTFVAYGEAELGPAPPGVTYPVYMPENFSGNYYGDFVDPTGDDDGDGIINFRDPDLVGRSALPTPNLNGSIFTLENGSAIDLKTYIANNDGGTLNNTNNNIVVSVSYSGITIGPNGEIEYFVGPGATILKPGWTLFQDIGSTHPPLPEPTPAYTGSDPFTTSTGTEVNIRDFISSPNSGSVNNTDGTITINSIYAGIIVLPDGTVTYFQPGVVEIPPGAVMFIDTTGLQSVLPAASPTYSDIDPYTTSGGANVNIKDYLENPNSGFVNNTGSTITMQVTDKSILVGPDGTVIQIDNPPTSVSIPDGYILFSEQSSFKKAFETQTGSYTPTQIPTPEPEPTAISTQWFEASNGDLILRESSFEATDPATQHFEFSGTDSIMPRETAYSSDTEDAQYFEMDANGNIIPINN